ncbi:NAD(P)H-dependent oxidoreductase [Amycolatopsis thermophila]|uniref:NAD(P)H dehydrogenase (Quinone) n=1 Tax=Amycolatopsis thermophila TaxID=206084 RepID=A0ABU0ETH8_9PSEU|nr:NAD(P)H-dependent oxidoreductase [Amycolatopsis thermophila]MDQ0378615.1 NAD(P)H dehydrogenase (quinone) [Amycolatopsis thermophila]
MNVLWIFAHPEGRSLNAALRDEGLRALEESGHSYRVSDLYAMKWNPVVGHDDFDREPGERLLVASASQEAYETGRLSADIRAEQEKLAWADAIVLQFPMWWYGMPAILKGWFDRVLVKGLGYGIAAEDGTVLRYGDGKLTGKRGMVVTTIGARESSIGPRGVHGGLDDLLFPLHHGTFWYTGIAPLPPYAVLSADRLDDAGFAAAADGLRDRLRTLETAEPIPFRYQNRGDYDENLVLRGDLATGRTDLAVHLRG